MACVYLFYSHYICITVLLMCNKAWLRAQYWIVSGPSSRLEHEGLLEGTTELSLFS